MKCNRCSKQAKFHITDLTEGEVLEMHLCPDCAKQYLQHEERQDDPDQPVSETLAEKLSPLKQATDDLRELDSRECPVCGISFFEFRQGGRLGCPHDYVFFSNELEPLLLSVHGETRHEGKTPKRGGVRDTESQMELIRLRSEMKDAVEQEDYELAIRLRDQIRQIEDEGRPSD